MLKLFTKLPFIVDLSESSNPVGQDEIELEKIARESSKNLTRKPEETFV